MINFPFSLWKIVLVSCPDKAFVIKMKTIESARHWKEEKIYFFYKKNSTLCIYIIINKSYSYTGLFLQNDIAPSKNFIERVQIQ